MCDFGAKYEDFISPPARTATCGKVATSESVTKDAGGGTPRAPIASGHKTSYGARKNVSMASFITVDVWLYGGVARYGGKGEPGSFANLQMRLPEGSTLADLLTSLKMRTEERGITFINGQLSAMPGLQPDLSHMLCDGDRVALFDLKSMWPFQYRHGAALTQEMAHAMACEKDDGLHHTYSKE